MSVRVTVDLPDDLYATLKQRAAAERTSIRTVIMDAIESSLSPKLSRRVTGQLVGKKGKLTPGSPDRENPYDVLFATTVSVSAPRPDCPGRRILPSP